MEQKTQYFHDVNLPQIELQTHTMPFKPPEDFYIEVDRLILKFIWKCKKLRIAKAILKKKTKNQSWKTHTK